MHAFTRLNVTLRADAPRNPEASESLVALGARIANGHLVERGLGTGFFACDPDAGLRGVGFAYARRYGVSVAAVNAAAVATQVAA